MLMSISARKDATSCAGRFVLPTTALPLAIIPLCWKRAGSISEINLRDTDLVNLPMALYAGADVILVGDIDRGGVFASVYGSLMLLRPHERERIKGILINKFRGYTSLRVGHYDAGGALRHSVVGVVLLP